MEREYNVGTWLTPSDEYIKDIKQTLVEKGYATETTYDEELSEAIRSIHSVKGKEMDERAFADSYVSSGSFVSLKYNENFALEKNFGDKFIVDKVDTKGVGIHIISVDVTYLTDNIAYVTGYNYMTNTSTTPKPFGALCNVEDGKLKLISGEAIPIECDVNDRYRFTKLTDNKYLLGCFVKNSTCTYKYYIVTFSNENGVYSISFSEKKTIDIGTAAIYQSNLFKLCPIDDKFIYFYMDNTSTRYLFGAILTYDNENETLTCESITQLTSIKSLVTYDFDFILMDNSTIALLSRPGSSSQLIVHFINFDENGLSSLCISNKITQSGWNQLVKIDDKTIKIVGFSQIKYCYIHTIILNDTASSCSNSTETIKPILISDNRGDGYSSSNVWSFLDNNKIISLITNLEGFGYPSDRDMMLSVYDLQNNTCKLTRLSYTRKEHKIFNLNYYNGRVRIFFASMVPNTTRNDIAYDEFILDDDYRPKFSHTGVVESSSDIYGVAQNNGENGQPIKVIIPNKEV